MREYLDMFLTFFKMGAFTFGGGYAMLPMIEREIIKKKKWATEDEVMDYYAIGQCTPGIIAVNTATFIGYFKKGIPGGIICTLGFVTPSVIIITLIASLLNNFAEIESVQNALGGIRIAVCVLMTASILKLFKNSIKDKLTLLIFMSAFLLSYFTNISTMILVILFGILGLALTNIKNRGKI